MEEVIGRLQTAKLQDDRRFAETYASSAGMLRGYSAHRIQTDLRGKGIDADVAASAAAVRPEAEVERARELAIRKLRTMGPVPPEVAARRLMGVLARRGYPPDLCREVVSEACETSVIEGFLDPDSTPDVR